MDVHILLFWVTEKILTSVFHAFLSLCSHSQTMLNGRQACLYIVSKQLNILDFDFGPNTIVYSFSIFFQKNLKSIAFTIVYEKGVTLRNRTA